MVKEVCLCTDSAAVRHQLALCAPASSDQSCDPLESMQHPEVKVGTCYYMGAGSSTQQDPTGVLQLIHVPSASEQLLAINDLVLG
jgi:hypothetical protein